MVDKHQPRAERRARRPREKRSETNGAAENATAAKEHKAIAADHTASRLAVVRIDKYTAREPVKTAPRRATTQRETVTSRSASKGLFLLTHARRIAACAIDTWTLVTSFLKIRRPESHSAHHATRAKKNEKKSESFCFSPSQLNDARRLIPTATHPHSSRCTSTCVQIRAKSSSS